MDPFTQILLGAAVGHATLGARVGRKALIWGAIFGGMPDLDIFLPHTDDVAAVTNHRGFSHSLITHTVVAPILGTGLARLHAKDGASITRWSLLVWLALATHALLDAITIYGTQLFWPGNGPPVGLGSIFIIDPLYTLLLLVGVLWAAFGKPRLTAGQFANKVGLRLSTLYLALAIFIQAQVRDTAENELARQGAEYDRLIATPTPFNLLLWRIVAMDPDGYREGYYSLLDPLPEIQFEHYPSNDSLLSSISDTYAVQRLRWFTKGFYRVREVDGRLEITDLRMGFEPRYIFSFVIGQRQEGVIRPLIPPTRTPAERPDIEALQWVWRRMLGERNLLP
ncbi:MAG: metal-dependent hydrolase [Candidatus Thiodiazotropha taylori]|nr:metal-dependent hydrolase [Candidatus Thiodiazotropha taylori]MCG8091227.1 metal-dependent hydrolase [Candidatus Thiodiazotropha taylori]MCW4231267.1 metal-dependent hydrolase [Candidatus Thiodiazotropha taylori]MCW4276608.1 metal-dependent hydrolase [Candidatus Thiodiazotropha taylori]